MEDYSCNICLNRSALLYATAANFLTYLFLTQVTCPYNKFFCLLHSNCYIKCRNCLAGVQKLKNHKRDFCTQGC